MSNGVKRCLPASRFTAVYGLNLEDLKGENLIKKGGLE
jgi:hypothetical protein